METSRLLNCSRTLLISTEHEILGTTQEQAKILPLQHRSRSSLANGSRTKPMHWRINRPSKFSFSSRKEWCGRAASCVEGFPCEMYRGFKLGGDASRRPLEGWAIGLTPRIPRQGQEIVAHTVSDTLLAIQMAIGLFAMIGKERASRNTRSNPFGCSAMRSPLYPPVSKAICWLLESGLFSLGGRSRRQIGQRGVSCWRVTFVEQPSGPRIVVGSMVPSRFSNPPPSLKRQSDVRVVVYDSIEAGSGNAGNWRKNRA